jgi:hypothetical protein
MHEELIQRLANPTVAGPELKIKSRQIGYLLKKMKADRTTADYHLDQTVPEAMAASSLMDSANMAEFVRV